MRAPGGAAAGLERVVDSLVGLGLFRGLNGELVEDGFGGGLDGLDGLHCLRFLVARVWFLSKGAVLSILFQI